MESLVRLATLLLLAIVAVPATARLTRAVVEDSITQPLRDFIARRAAPSKRHAPASTLWKQVATLTSCTWCASVWVSSAVTTGSMAWYTGQPSTEWDFRTWWVWFLWTMATSWSASIAHDWLDAPPPTKQVAHAPMHLNVALRDQRR